MKTVWLLINELTISLRLSKNNYIEPVIISELDPKQKLILDELGELDVDNLKPIDALMLLNKWKKEIDE